MFFFFIKSFIMFLLLRFIIVDFYNIYSSVAYGTYCLNASTKVYCASSLFTYSSSFNKTSIFICYDRNLKTKDYIY